MGQRRHGKSRRLYCFFYREGRKSSGNRIFCTPQNIVSSYLVSDRMSCIVLRGRRYNIIVLNVHAPSEKKSNDSKDSFYEEFYKVFYHFPKDHTRILLGDFTVKLGREDIFKLTIGNENLHQDSNDSGVRIVKFATSKNLVAKSRMFPHHRIHKYTWASPDWETHNLINHILSDRR